MSEEKLSASVDGETRLNASMLSAINDFPPDLLIKLVDVDARRSLVRVNVTYLVVACYMMAALGVLGFVMYQTTLANAEDNTDLILAVFGSIGAVSGTVMGFWFGTRGTGGTDAMNALMRVQSTATEEQNSGTTDPGAGKTAPTAGSTDFSDQVKRIQTQLNALAESMQGQRWAESVRAGPVDGVLGNPTISAINTALAMLDPPLRYEDLQKPNVLGQVISGLDRVADDWGRYQANGK